MQPFSACLKRYCAMSRHANPILKLVLLQGTSRAKFLSSSGLEVKILGCVKVNPGTLRVSTRLGVKRNLFREVVSDMLQLPSTAQSTVSRIFCGVQ